MNEVYPSTSDLVAQQQSNEFTQQIKELEEQNRYLIKQLVAAYHTMTTVLEIETQMNKHQSSWTHSDRRAVAELVIKICQQQLNRLPVPLTREAIATYSDNF